jgi:hypothetical protein
MARVEEEQAARILGSTETRQYVRQNGSSDSPFLSKQLGPRSPGPFSFDEWRSDRKLGLWSTELSDDDHPSLHQQPLRRYRSRHCARQVRVPSGSEGLVRDPLSRLAHPRDRADSSKQITRAMPGTGPCPKGATHSQNKEPRRVGRGSLTLSIFRPVIVGVSSGVAPFVPDPTTHVS